MPPKRKNSQISLGDDSQPPRKLTKAETKALNKQKGQALAAAKKAKKTASAGLATTDDPLTATSAATSAVGLPPATVPEGRRLRGGEIPPRPAAAPKEPATRKCTKCGQKKKGHICQAVGATAARKNKFAAAADEDAEMLLDGLPPRNHARDGAGAVLSPSPLLAFSPLPPPLDLDETTDTTEALPADDIVPTTESEEADALLKELTRDDLDRDALGLDRAATAEPTETEPAASKPAQGKGKGKQKTATTSDTTKASRPTLDKDEDTDRLRAFDYSVTFKPAKPEGNEEARVFATNQLLVRRKSKIQKPMDKVQMNAGRFHDKWQSAVNAAQIAVEALPGYTILIHRPLEVSPWIRVFWNERLQDAAPASEHGVSLEGKDADGRPILDDSARRDVKIPQVVHDVVEEFCLVTDPLVKKQAKSASRELQSVAAERNRLALELDAEKEKAAKQAAEIEELKRAMAAKNAADE